MKRVGFIRHDHMQRSAVNVRKHGNTPDVHLPASPDDPDCNLSTICYEQAADLSRTIH
jgi:hypothetical protein